MPETISPQLALYRARKAAGRCVRCGGKRDDVYSLCSKCREYQRQRDTYNAARMTPEQKAARNAKHRINQKALRDRRRAAGLCTKCGAPSDGKYICAACAARANALRRETGK